MDMKKAIIKEYGEYLFNNQSDLPIDLFMKYSFVDDVMNATLEECMKIAKISAKEMSDKEIENYYYQCAL